MTDDQLAPSDFIYVDPETRTVVGRVQWTQEGVPVSQKRAMPEPRAIPAPVDQKERRRPPRERNYPWGTLKSMHNIFKLKDLSRDKEPERYIPLEDAIAKLMVDPYWN